MSDRMRQIPFGRLMDWILTEYEREGSVFGVKNLYKKTGDKTLEIFGEKLEIPAGPAAGPHTQLAQNIAAAYAAGSRFFELKTVQALDGDALPVSKPCILALDEGYNVEWSTELYVPQALDEYIKGWFALKLMSRELGLGAADGFVFNMSVGYDLAGIMTPKIDGYIESMKDAEKTESWQTCKSWALENLARFSAADEAYIESLSPKICGSITLSTLHGCPPQEIERIAEYLLTEKKLHTFVKCNPTLLGYEYARRTLDGLGFDYVKFGDRHFKGDLQFADAVPMFRRLQAKADSLSLSFGVKLTNTFPAWNTPGDLPGEEMYMSGRALFPLSIEVANRLSKEFGGKLRISYSGGADLRNIDKIYGAGIWPVTVATTLLKPGGYQRMNGIAEKLSACEYKPFEGVDLAKLRGLAEQAGTDALYRKPAGRPPERKIKAPLPLLDCFTAPCRSGCPLEQDIPAYLRLAGEGKHLEALRVITERNPLPFITGTICSHRCMDKCTRSFYEDSVHIRKVKLEAAQKSYTELMKDLKRDSQGAMPLERGAGQSPVGFDAKIAIIGGGPAGLSAAYFLAQAGRPVTIFEKSGALGGTVRHVIPDFRIGGEAIDNDVALVMAMGVEVRLNTEVKSLDALRAEGFGQIIVAVGAWKPGVLKLEEGSAMGSLEFLQRFKSGPNSLNLGANVAVVGGGNTAMDAARAAKRVPGVKNVSLVYRRTRRYMPADGEELQLALEEGVEFRELLAPVALRGGVLVCERMELAPPDASGRRGPVPTGLTVEVPADTVIAAVGDATDRELYGAFGIAADERGRPVVNAETFETAVPGVYAVGDALRGPATVAEAVGDALRCARAMTGRSPRYAELNVNPDSGPAENKKGVLYCDCSSVHESDRCLECATLCRICADVCPNRANVEVIASGRPQIIHIDSMCNECGNCAAFCPYSGAPYKEKFTLFSSEEDFADSDNPGFLILNGGTARVRLDGKTAEYRDGSGLPAGIWDLIQAVMEKGYVFV